MMDEITLTNIPMLIMPAAPKEESESKVRCLIAGPLPIDITNGSRTFEYWLCDVILLPKKKYTETDDGYMHGWRYHDILEKSDWPNPKNWKEITNEQST